MASKFDNIKGHIFCTYGGNMKEGMLIIEGIITREPIYYLKN